MTTEDKCSQINYLLDSKGVHIVQGYMLDYFKDDENEQVIFSVKSQRLGHIDEVLDEILEKLSSYNKCKKCKKPIESRFRYCSIKCKSENLAT